MALHTAHKYSGADLDEIVNNFAEVNSKFRILSLTRMDKLDEILFNAYTQCRLVEAMYKLNDFKASCSAYQFTVPNIEKIIVYVFKNFDTPAVKSWCNSGAEFCVAQNPDGSTRQYTNLGFLYDVMLDRQMAIGARYFIKCNIQYLEKEKAEKDYPSRRRILESAIWWCNQGLLGRFGLKMPDWDKQFAFTPETVIFATFPSSGKSYLINTINEMYAELAMAIDSMGGMLRVGNEQGNIFRQSRQTMALIDNKLIFNVYPENKEYISSNGKYNPFNKSSEEEWGLGGVIYDPSTCIFKTRDSAINSVRCKIAVMDDPTRGQQESTNVNIHKQICNLYNGDFKDRFKKQSDKFIVLCGTMYMPTDVISTEIQNALADGFDVDKRFKNTYISADKKTIAIVNDCEDEYGNSAYPEFISNEDLKKKRNSLDAYDYACVWRQKPIPQEGLIFDYALLNQYDSLDTAQLSKCSYAYIDPTRRSAKDYFAFPICKYDIKADEYVLVDAIFKRKSQKELYDEIVEKIIENTIVRLVIEENVDASLSTVLAQKLEKKGVKWCEIVNKYNTVNKSRRIAEYAGVVKKTIRFPSQKAKSNKTEVGHFVYLMTQYSPESKGFDDSPDAMAGFAENLIVNANKRNTIKTSNKFPI